MQNIEQRITALQEKIAKEESILKPHEKRNRTKIVQSILVSFFFVFTLMIYGPLELYLHNIREFWFTLTDIVPVVAVCAAVTFVLIFAVLMLTRGKVHDIILCIVFAFGFGFFIQGTLLNIQYDVLNGQEIVWQNYTGLAVLNTGIWIVLLVLPFLLWRLKKELWSRLTKILSVLLLFLQIVLLGVLLLTTPAKSNKLYYSTDGLFDVGTENNIIVFLLDTYDKKIFEEIFEQSPEFLEPLDGFTFFKNSVGSYPTTKGAIPYLLTGQYYENDKPYTDYLDDAFKKTSFYSELYDNSYDSRVYSQGVFISKEANYIDNIAHSKSVISSYTGFVSLMAKFTAFSYFPHVMKPLFWFYSGDFDKLRQVKGSPAWILDDPAFYEKLKSQGLSLSDEENTFRFYHMYGMHPPYNMDENSTSADDVSYLDQAKGCLNIIFEYISQLKQLGVYDNTTFIIMADHGNYTGLYSDLLHQPLFVIKQPGATGALKVSKAPISHADFMPTILQCAGLPYKDFGESVFDIGEDDVRIRRYLRYIWDDGWDNDFLPDITEYFVRGEADDISSYLPTWRRFTENGVESSAPVVDLGNTVLVSDSKFGECFIHGFGGPEVSEGNVFAWTVGKNGVLNFKTDKVPDEGVVVELDLFRIYANVQRLKVYFGEQQLLDETIQNGTNKVKITIPNFCFTENNEISLMLELPDAVSPASRGENEDPRELALAMTSMYVGPAK